MDIFLQLAGAVEEHGLHQFGLGENAEPDAHMEWVHDRLMQGPSAVPSGQPLPTLQQQQPAPQAAQEPKGRPLHGGCVAATSASSASASTGPATSQPGPHAVEPRNDADWSWAARQQDAGWQWQTTRWNDYHSDWQAANVDWQAAVVDWQAADWHCSSSYSQDGQAGTWHDGHGQNAQDEPQPKRRPRPRGGQHRGYFCSKYGTHNTDN